MDEPKQLNEDENGTACEQDSDQEENASRMDAAKAFFRALHAGADLSQSGLASGAATETGTGPCPSCQRLVSQVAQAEQRAAESESLYKRMAADFDNYRRRIDREREEFLAAGVQKAVEVLLPALDDMDRAQSSLHTAVPPEKFIESLNLVFNRVRRCLEQVGVKALNVVGVHFDPRFHEPVQEIETTEFPDGAVMQELRRGYTLGDKVIRPALVNVASNNGGVLPAVELFSAADQDTPKNNEPKVYDLSGFEDLEDNIQGAEPSSKS